jgi:DNA-binding beta-propeller fold protein YncE
VISTATNNVIKTVDVGFLPHSIAISPDGTRAYVTNGGSDTVSVLQLV